MNGHALRACDLECGLCAATWFNKEVMKKVEAMVAGRKVQRPGACPTKRSALLRWHEAEAESGKL